MIVTPSRGGEKLGAADNYKEFTYTGNNLTSLDVWFDNTKALKLYDVAYTYTGVNLTQTVRVEYAANGVDIFRTITTTFSYTGARLEDTTTIET